MKQINGAAITVLTMQNFQCNLSCVYGSVSLCLPVISVPSLDMCLNKFFCTTVFLFAEF